MGMALLMFQMNFLPAFLGLSGQNEQGAEMVNLLGPTC